METNYKQLDRDRVLLYLKEHGVSTVDAIVEQSGVEPLRIYPLLFELAQERVIRIVEENAWGSPLKVELTTEI